MRHLLVVVVLMLTLRRRASAFQPSSLQPQTHRHQHISCSSAVSRHDFMASLLQFTLAFSTILAVPTVANAKKEVDPGLKGTKADPEFESCMSKCVYECTKPKGVEQKSRAECRGECKAQCATTKQQLMIGQPKP